ncbi:hypothetical protein [Streptomyces phaeochromogenes]
MPTFKITADVRHGDDNRPMTMTAEVEAFSEGNASMWADSQVARDGHSCHGIKVEKVKE